MLQYSMLICNNLFNLKKNSNYTRCYSMMRNRHHIDVHEFTPNRRKIDAKLAQSFSHNRRVKDEQGRAIGEEGQKKRWREHLFEKLLNRDAPQNPSNISPAETHAISDSREDLISGGKLRKVGFVWVCTFIILLLFGAI